MTLICTHCSLIQLAEPWDDAAFEAFYRHDYRRMYGERTPSPKTFSSQLIRSGDIVAFCAPFLRRGCRVLDIGAYTGGCVHAFKTLLEADAVGIEPDEVESAYARSLGLDVRTGIAENADFPPGSFELVVIAGTINHLAHPFRVVDKVRGWLTGTGLLFVSIGDVIEAARVEPEPFTRDHAYYFTSRTLRSLIARRGFEPVRWRNRTYREAVGSTQDVVENHLSRSSIEGLFRVSDSRYEPFAPFDWQTVKSDFESAARTSRRRSRPVRALRRALRAISE